MDITVLNYVCYLSDNSFKGTMKWLNNDDMEYDMPKYMLCLTSTMPK